MSDPNMDGLPTEVPSDGASGLPPSLYPSTSGETVSIWDTVAGPGVQPPSIDLDEGTEGDSSRLAGGKGSDSEETAGRYKILAEIARGGMGAVLRGRDAELNRELAIKVLLETHRESPEVLRRFFEEAQIGGQLQHPGIVPIYDIGVLPDLRPFFAMKLVKGRTLAAMLKERESLSEGRSRYLSIFEAIAQTVAYAHSRNVIHRDLKPLNVMVGSFGEVQVMDWGLAKVLQAGVQEESPASPGSDSSVSVIDSGRDDSETSAGSKMGTPSYMPPEQARGEVDRVGKAADVFSLGAILCEILTGSPPYLGATTAAILRKAEYADLDDARSRLESSGADPDLIGLALRCLAREIEDRPSDASAVSAAVSAHLATVQARLRAAEIARVEADARAEIERSKAEAGRTRLRMTLAAAGSLLLAMTVGGGWYLSHQARQAESDRIVGDALARAEALISETQRTRPEALEGWEAAYVAVDKAHASLSGRSVRADLMRRVESAFALSESSVTKARAAAARLLVDRKLVRQLDEARLKGTALKDGHFDDDAKFLAYDMALRDVGVVFGEQPASEIIARLSGAEQADQIAAALDDWTRRAASKLKTDLITVAESIDQDRNELRRAIRRQDARELSALAQGPEAGRLVPTSVVNLASALMNLGQKDEAIRLFSRARSLAPGDFWLNHDLGMALSELEPARLDEAARYLTAAVALRPDSPGANINLGNLLNGQKHSEEAEMSYREAIRLDPQYAAAHCNLGVLLFDQKRLVEAEASYREAIRLDPQFAIAHCNLGNLLLHQKLYKKAEASYREAIRLDPQYANTHHNLGTLLFDQKRLVEAEASFREAIRLDPQYAMAHYNLGVLLSAQRRPVEAEASYREAIRLDPKHAMARCNMGSLLFEQKHYEEAEASYREAIRLDPGDFKTHYNLGSVLTTQRKYREALEELRLAHELGLKRRDYASGEWVREAERLVAQETRLPAVVKGEDKPKDAAEGLELAQMCYDKKLYGSAAKLWDEALKADPRLGEDPRAGVRYNAACAASLAGSGRVEDERKPDEAERVALRKMARDDLRGDLEEWKRVALTAGKGNKELVKTTLDHWKEDPDLSGVREKEGLAKMTEGERKEWEALWGEVDEVLKKVGKPAGGGGE